jgi:FCP1-like phosphatase family protein
MYVLHQTTVSNYTVKSILEELNYNFNRPGWKQFLQSTAVKYEMHVYTMGTRAYAEEVCAAIDPDGTVFGGRLLSRDESGSLTQKSLQRLFPCDTSMVVIIDDRADVWEWSPNLVKVVPCECHTFVMISFCTFHCFSLLMLNFMSHR